MIPSAIFWTIAAIVLLLGVIPPIIVRKKCVERVNATLSPKKMKKQHSYTDGINTFSYIGIGTYYWGGVKYTAKLRAENRCTSIKLLINPNKPKQHVYASKKYYYLRIVSFSLFAAICVVFGTVFLFQS